MNFIDAENIILSHFMTEWESDTSSIPVAYENQTSSVDYDNLNTSWVRLVVKNTGSIQYSMGEAPDRKWMRYGLVGFQVFIKPSTAVYDGKVLCETIKNMFEGKRIQGVVFKEGVYDTVGIVGKWFQINGNIRWEFDEDK